MKYGLRCWFWLGVGDYSIQYKSVPQQCQRSLGRTGALEPWSLEGLELWPVSSGESREAQRSPGDPRGAQGITQGSPGSSGELRGAQGSPGKLRGAQGSRGGPRGAQESPEQLRGAQGSSGEPRGAQGSSGETRGAPRRPWGIPGGLIEQGSGGYGGRFRVLNIIAYQGSLLRPQCWAWVLEKIP